ncbi:phage baseplate assembly protein domain-containing protein [Saccharibacter floricola]|uniref:Phage baseplate assembly protein n=1 Tax=Saccharibacter floricola DSM 15669 TaxID=1123227 RepID=A0ABQ0P0L1_9PROT|nr:phage baseplate assembly protein [Saccharibacter floricola]GBQ08001.1 phage baseplate assembly protein [Saccharibacter floricola DSM 15669]
MSSFARLAGRLAFLFSLGRQTADTVMKKGGQTLQLLLTSRELRDNIPLLQHYGFVSRPRAGCDALVIFLGGDRSRPVAIATNDQRNYPTSLNPGEVCITHPPTGSIMRFMDDGSISIIPQNGIVNLTGSLNVSENITATGTITGQTDVIAHGISSAHHTHTGVQSGGSSTGAPQ